VTVVFADLAGSTARAERLDPEDVRAILAPYHDRLRHELERHGGTVEKFIGDAVMGVFGAPVAHEDDAERAVRAALAIQEAIADLNEADPTLELEVRIGVHTGEALVSLNARPKAGEATVAGDVMNTAARLQAVAPAGGVLVGDATHRATSRAIEYRAADAIAATGKADPVAAWIAAAPRSRFGVDVFQTGRAPLVGPERELELLSAALGRARRSASRSSSRSSGSRGSARAGSCPSSHGSRTRSPIRSCGDRDARSPTARALPSGRSARSSRRKRASSSRRVPSGPRRSSRRRSPISFPATSGVGRAAPAAAARPGQRGRGRRGPAGRGFRRLAPLLRGARRARPGSARVRGSPLYAEEYARMLEAAETPSDVPKTLQGVVAARIDALPPAEKALLQQAAVFGEVFWTDALAAVLETDEWQLGERLHALDCKEFVRREQRSAVAGARQYVFVHALVRDGAYWPDAARRARTCPRACRRLDRVTAVRSR
jgi:class 3 adenylate cyclase